MTTYLNKKPLDPIRKFRFEVYTEDGRIQEGEVGFAEVDSISLGQTGLIEWAEGNDAVIRKLPARTKWPNITLRKGLDAGRHLAQWYEQVVECLADEPGFVGVSLRDMDDQTRRILAGKTGLRSNVIIAVYDRTATSPNSMAPYIKYRVKNALPIDLSIDSLKGDEDGVAVETMIIAPEKVMMIYPKRRA